jgi:purine-binding chemotaxis protein CheW
MGEFQVVICELADESYGIDISSVFEIIRHQEATAVPTAPAYVDGVINLRGRIIPVMDLSARFGMARSKVTKETRIIVAGTDHTRVGLVVDAVSEVLMLSEDAVDKTPQVVAGGDSGYIKGIAKVGSNLVILLDLVALLGDPAAALKVA